MWARWLRNPYRLGVPYRSHNQRLPALGHGGYKTPAASLIPTASERGADSEVAHLWARWLLNLCRLGNAHCFRPGGRIRSGTLVGKVDT